MRHVNLDPVGAVLDLLARDLAHLHWTVAELRAFWDHDVRVVAFERVATGDRDRARDHEHTRTWNVAVVDGFFDPDVPIARALSLDVADCGESLFQGAMDRDHSAGSTVR